MLTALLLAASISGMQIVERPELRAIPILVPSPPLDAPLAIPHEAEATHAPQYTPDQFGMLGYDVPAPVSMMGRVPQEEQGKRDNVLRTGAVFLAALTVAEIEVTRAVLERGGRELNALYKPFEDKPGVLGLVNGAITGGLGIVALELNRRGKKLEARIFVWTMIAAKAIVFGHNLHQLRKSR